MSFGEFWEDECKFWADLATLLFYGGAFTLLVAIIIFMWATFFTRYQSLTAAMLAVLLIGLSIVVGVGIGLMMRLSNKK
jgi:hypothetical protein